MRDVNSFVIALTTSFCIWILFFICVIVIPIPKQEEPVKYGEMLIQLVSEQLPPEKENEIPQEQKLPKKEVQEIEQTVPSIEKKSVLQSESSTPSELEKNTVIQESVAESPKQIEEPIIDRPLAKSMEELIAESNAKRDSSKTVEWSDTMFENSSFVTSDAENIKTLSAKKTESFLSGSVSEVTSTENEAAVFTTGKNDKVENADVSSKTGEILSEISGAKNKQRVSDDTVSSESAVSTDVANVYGITFTDSARKMLPPSPNLVISKENKQFLKSTTKVKVSFDVSPSGNVQPTTIVFTPSALIPQEMQTELKEQISKWRFEEGESTGQATFNYSIIVE